MRIGGNVEMRKHGCPKYTQCGLIRSIFCGKTAAHFFPPFQISESNCFTLGPCIAPIFSNVARMSR